ncbi:MAG: hypothetical protein ABII82_04630, partial [Verrucomicrobiota bacterium]
AGGSCDKTGCVAVVSAIVFFLLCRASFRGFSSYRETPPRREEKKLAPHPYYLRPAANFCYT